MSEREGDAGEFKMNTDLLRFAKCTYSQLPEAFSLSLLDSVPSFLLMLWILMNFSPFLALFSSSGLGSSIDRL